MNLIVLVLFIFIAISCDDKIVSECETDEKEIEEKITFTWIQQNVFTPQCATAGCHSTPNPAGSMDLSHDHAYEQLVSVTSSQVADLFRVSPNNSNDSYLVLKLMGSDERLAGSIMPPGGPYLTQTTIDSIKIWIDRGALED